jgi:serine phosphatase RsbU (regulator of sigma subunit)
MPLALGAEPHEIRLPYGLPLGLVEDATWEVNDVELGDAGLLAYTDGLVEGFAGPESRERFGTDRLLAALVAAAGAATPHDRPAETLVDVARQANGGPLADDVAVLYVEPA